MTVQNKIYNMTQSCSSVHILFLQRPSKSKIYNMTSSSQIDYLLTENRKLLMNFSINRDACFALKHHFVMHFIFLI